MQNNIINRWVLIIGAIALSILFLINDINYYKSDKEGISKSSNSFLFDSKVINLGLDLQGGKEFLLAPKIDTWLKQLFDSENQNILSDERKALFNALSDFYSSHSNDDATFTLDSLSLYLEKTNNSIKINNLFNGKDKDAIYKDLKDALKTNVNIIRNRIDDKGVLEPTIRIVGDKISVQIPGKQNINRLESIITSSAKLEFTEVIKGPNLPIYEWNQFINIKTSKWPNLKKLLSKDLDTELLFLKKENVSKFKDELIKLEASDRWFTNYKFIYYDAKSDPRLSNFVNSGDKLLCVVLKNPIIEGKQVVDANTSTDQGLTSGYVVNLKLDSKKGLDKKESAASIWSNYTEKNIGKIVAITLDDNIMTSPVIRSKIPNGECVITGFETISDANHVSTQLKHGKLNLPLKIDYKKNNGPELGKKMIELGIFAFIIGISCVIVFMIIYYKNAGLMASIALLLNIIFMTSILSLLGATLTLPGIAGFILTIGIAVDANVIIFERIKEELQKGTPPLSAIESGYNRAFVTIIDANITTLLTAFILFVLGSGPIKGFAITLSAGIVCSMFTAIFVTRTIFNTIYYSKIPKKLSI